MSYGVANAGRKSPVVLLKYRRPVDARQAIWDEIRRVGDVPTDAAEGITVRRLSAFCKVPPRTVQCYLECLVAGGFLSRDDHAFALIRDVGLHAPRLRADGSPVEQGKGRTAAWKGMRVMKRFTARDLHNATGAHLADIKSFAVYLVRGGYLKIVAGGHGRTPATYQLIRDTGPRAPQVSRIKFIYDPNLNAVTWPTEAVEIEPAVEGTP